MVRLVICSVTLYRVRNAEGTTKCHSYCSYAEIWSCCENVLVIEDSE